MEENEENVMDWINDHFILNEIEIEDFPFFPHGKLIRDKNEETMVVFLVCNLWTCGLSTT